MGLGSLRSRASEESSRTRPVRRGPSCSRHAGLLLVGSPVGSLSRDRVPQPSDSGEMTGSASGGRSVASVTVRLSPAGAVGRVGAPRAVRRPEVGRDRGPEQNVIIITYGRLEELRLQMFELLVMSRALGSDECGLCESSLSVIVSIISGTAGRRGPPLRDPGPASRACPRPRPRACQGLRPGKSTNLDISSN